MENVCIIFFLDKTGAIEVLISVQMKDSITTSLGSFEPLRICLGSQLHWFVFNLLFLLLLEPGIKFLVVQSLFLAALDFGA